MTMPETVEEIEWTPEYITSSLWLDAADSETITMDGSGNVEQWDDKSGDNKHATQSTVGARPSLDTINSLDMLCFDRTNGEYLNVTDQPIVGTTSRTIFSVVQTRTYGSIGHGFIGLTTNRSGSGSCWDHCIESNAFYIRVDGNAYWTPTTDLDTVCLHSVIWAGGDIDNAFVWQNGNALSLSGGAYCSINTLPGYLTVGATLTQPTGQYFNGDIGEIVIYDSALPTENRQKMEGYLAHKWGLEANLPSGHPYKTSAPTTYVNKIPTYYFEGTVIGGISQYVERNIRLYRYDTGELMNTTTSVSGSFFITTTHSGTHYITCHDLPYGEYNDLIFGKITPGITYD
jgi:hypothetical protein